MKKQTKLVAVLSTASLLAIGASMTSFAATGWVEENGTWVYYNRDGELATDSWKKSGNSWYWLDENGEMAIDQLIEDDEDYYYVDINGVMATNQWVAIENEDAGEDDEPEHYWYYFQANGKALTNGNNSNVALKTVNGKKYAFDDEGKMLWGWVSEDDAEHLENTDGNAFMDGMYYFGDSDDGAMTTGWIQLDITYDNVTDSELYGAISPVFTDDEDQTRWFYFMSNGKKVHSDADDEIKERSINGKKYGFDNYGAMVAEWSVDVDRASDNEVDILGSRSTADANDTGDYKTGKYAQQWRYFQSVEDGSKLSRGWFKVVSAEYLNEEKYDDDEESWYYADGSGDIYAGEFKTISGKKYAFRNDGRMIDGLKFIKEDGDDSLSVKAWDDDDYPFDNEDDFLQWAVDYYTPNEYNCYYFGSSEDGAMKTGKTTVELDGENYTFFFKESGSKKGQGVTGEEDDKLYQSGMLLSAGNDEKYQVVKHQKKAVVGSTEDETVDTYTKLDDVAAFLAEVDAVVDEVPVSSLDEGQYVADWYLAQDYCYLSASDLNRLDKDAEDLDELYIINWNKDDDGDYDEDGKWHTEDPGLVAENYILVNKSGKIVDDDTRSTDGEDYVYVTNTQGQIVAIYLEN